MAKSNILRAIDQVAEQAAGPMLEILQNGTKEIGKSDLEPGEAAVVWLLRQQLDLAKAS